MTLHRDLSGLSVLGYWSELLRSTWGESLWLIKFSGRVSGMVAHDAEVALHASLSLATIAFPKKNMITLPSYAKDRHRM